MKVLLLGPNGQLGHDIRRLHEQEGGPFELIAVPRKQLDVAVAGMVEKTLAAEDFDVLINCTSYHKTDEVEDNATSAFAVNTHAVQAMAQICATKRARLIHISTDYVFGGDVTRTRPLREDDPVAPVNVYGASKAMGETLARLATDDVVILRVASLFGVAGASSKGGNFVETIIRRGRETRTLRVVDDQIMSPTATADVARVVMKMVRDGCSSGLYHVVNTGAASWFDFARSIIHLAGVDATVTPCSTRAYHTRATRPRYCVLDNVLTSASFGEIPAWQDSLGDYLRRKGHLSP